MKGKPDVKLSFVLFLGSVRVAMFVQDSHR